MVSGSNPDGGTEGFNQKHFIRKHAIKFPGVEFALALGLTLSLRSNRARSACETVFS